MPRKAKELKAIEVSRLTEAGHHAVGGVSGLYLYVLDSGARSWVLRTVVGSKRRHMGLGAYPEVGLAAAREKARLAKDEVERGLDPIEQRIALAATLREKQASVRTFEEISHLYIDAKGDEWKNLKHRAQWLSTLKTYAFPNIGKIPIKELTQENVLEVLNPIWKEKTETASRLRGRIEAIIDWATAKKYREGENPARWKGSLDALLLTPGKIKKVKHHTAVSLDKMPEVFRQITLAEGIASKALLYAILCAARSGEVRNSEWQEIDFKSSVWIVPAAHMKAGVEHHVPLSLEAKNLLGSLGPKGSGIIFKAPKGGCLSDMALTSVMRRLKIDAVPHGFRSTFRDWAGEKTNYPRELAEQALAHTLKDKVEAAYRRGNMLEKRRVMMQDWANFCLNHL